MSRQHRVHRAATALVRLLVVYLCLILAWQGIAAAVALGAGPLHRHRNTAADVASAASGPSVASLAFSHHGHAHATGQRHVHAAIDASVQAMADADEATDALASALTSALSLLALDTPRPTPDAGADVWPASASQHFTTRHTSPLFKPPRQA